MSELPTSVDKSLRLLFAFTPGREAMRLAELTRATGLTKSTAHRLATGLVEAGLLDYDPVESTYSLGIRILDLSNTLIEASPVRRAALAQMSRLYVATQQTLSLTVPDRGEMVIVERFGVRAPVPPPFQAPTLQIGTRLPLVYSAQGRAYLAWLDREDQTALVRQALEPIVDGRSRPASPWPSPKPATVERVLVELTETRRRGYARQDGEVDPWNRAIACPIFGKGSRPRGALGIVSFDPAVSLARLERDLASTLIDVCHSISASLGHRA